MFADKAKIYIKAGNGGHGLASFRREKYVPNGGPDGGDGGNGGSVIFVADENINTLIDFRNKRHYKAGNGENGKAKKMHGKTADDLIVKVPVGTIIREFESNKIMADLAHPGDEKVIAKGGKGGLGNQHFATSKMQAPKYAEKGRDGREYWLTLELKMIADVGLIGFPNVGKSTILSVTSNANPKIGNYHFTTINPNLGVVKTKYDHSFVIADIPGIIEGAHMGVGLGYDFLRHIERTRVLIHVVDGSGLEGRDPIEDIKKINEELYRYNERLVNLPQVIAINKTDIPDSFENVEKIREKFSATYKIFEISAVTNTGLNDLMNYVGQMLESIPQEVFVFESEYEEEYEEEDEIGYSVEKTDKDYYVVEGPIVERMLGYTNLETEKGFAHLQKFMKEKGIINELKQKGIQDGDTVKLGDIEFEYFN
ncbi:MAG: GTPase ObgE [Clostridia bacterium]|jgi:GTP-binding protein|nr:GTPase ObgE [Clostridia bacterium]